MHAVELENIDYFCYYASSVEIRTNFRNAIYNPISGEFKALIWWLMIQTNDYKVPRVQLQSFPASEVSHILYMRTPSALILIMNNTLQVA